MFSKHYQSELQFLRGMGKEFAATYPSMAGLLAERGGDPDVERLLEGFAFLAARVHERLDDAVPELVHQLAEILAPQLVRSIPAATVIEFLPVAGGLRTRLTVPAGAELASVPVDGVSCRFRTSAPVELVPVALQDAVLDQAIGAAPCLRLTLQCAAPALPSVFQDEGIRFFIQGDLPLASTVLLWMARHLVEVRVKALTSGRELSLGPGAVQLPGFGPELPLLPWPPLAPAAYRSLLEYFTLPQKFLFFDVRGLGAARPQAEERFELAFQFSRPPELPGRIGRDVFRVNCAPVVNLFAASGDPIRVEAPGEEHLVRAAGMDPRHVEVFSIDAVTGAPDPAGRRRDYPSFASFAHGRSGSPACYHRLRLQRSSIDDGIDAYLSVLTPRDGGPGPAEEVLSTELTCTNRSLAGRLRLGEVTVSTQTSPTVARFRNVLPVTYPARPPLGGDLQWRLLSHLAASRASLGRAGTLRRALELYNFPALADQSAGRANQLRIDGIRAVEAAQAHRLVRGALVAGGRMQVLLDEGHFAGPGDAFVFGGVLDAFLGAHAPMNTFVELALRLEPSLREYTWTPRSGTRPLL